MFLRVCVPVCVCSQGWRSEERESQGLTEGGAAEEVQQLHHWTQRHGGHRHSGLRGHLWTHAHFLLPCVQWRAFTSRCQHPTAQQMCVWKGRFIFTFLHGTMKTTDVRRLFLFYNGFKYVVMSMWVQTSVTSQNPLMKRIQNNCEYKCEYKPLNTNTIITFQHN